MAIQSELDTVASAVRSTAATEGWVLWPGEPVGPWVDSPVGSSVEDFLGFARRVGVRVMYLGTGTQDDVSYVIATFAVEGVLHRFWMNTGDVDWSLGGDDSLEIDAEQFGADFEERMSWSYYDELAGERVELPSELRPLVERVLAEPSYDGRRGDAAVVEATAGLPLEMMDRVAEVSRLRFRRVVAPGLDGQARRVALKVRGLETFHPLMSRSAIGELAAAAEPALNPRVAGRVTGFIMTAVYEDGSFERARAGVRDLAQERVDAMAQRDIDRLVFSATRNAALTEALSPVLATVEPTAIREEFVGAVKLVLEFRRSGVEARYATAVRARLSVDPNRAAASRLFGISTAALDRVISSFPNDVVLDSDDPLVELLGR